MRYDKIQPGFFDSNRKRLSSKLKQGSVAFVFGHFQMPRNGDQFFPYRQDSNFFYLTGIEQEKSILVLAPDAPKEQQEILYILKSNKTLETWEGHKLTPEEASEISGIKTVHFLDNFEIDIHPIILNAKFLFFNVPENQKFDPEIKSRDEIYLHQLKQKYPLHAFERLAPLLAELRLEKSETEINLIRKACSITKEAFLIVLKELKPGMKEYEVEALITREFIRQGANGHAYSPIVASGARACFLHYIENDKVCEKDDLLLMDFGAEYANYAADLSRTVPVNGKFNKRQRELYDTAFRVFLFARNCIKPGISINGFHKEVCNYWEEEHIKLGLYTKEDVKNHKGENPLWFNYYMHGTSHFMGLDVHDAGTREIILRPGMVLTCEPAIYISEENTGIRLENDLLITENGNIDLMEDIPMAPDEIEALMNS